MPRPLSHAHPRAPHAGPVWTEYHLKAGGGLLPLPLLNPRNRDLHPTHVRWVPTAPANHARPHLRCESELKGVFWVVSSPSAPREPRPGHPKMPQDGSQEKGWQPHCPAGRASDAGRAEYTDRRGQQTLEDFRSAPWLFALGIVYQTKEQHKTKQLLFQVSCRTRCDLYSPAPLQGCVKGPGLGDVPCCFCLLL